MSNQDIIQNIFFNEIIKEANKSEVSIIESDGYEHIYNIGFNACIEGKLNSGDVSDSKPILMINNKKQLLNMLEKYIQEVDKTTNNFSDCEYNQKIKAYMSFVWCSATYEDLASPIGYLKKQIDFLQTPKFELEESIYAKNIDFSNVLNNKNVNAIDLLNGCDITINVKQQNINHEAPFAFQSIIKQKIDGVECIYKLPSINYGISNNECYIYAIQDFNSDKEKQSVLGKTIYKVFHSLDENIDGFESNEYIDYDSKNKPQDFRINEDKELIGDDVPENISRVSPMVIVALTIFLDSLLKQGIDKVKVVSCLPIRYYGKELYYLKKYDYYKEKNKLSKEEADKLLFEYKKEHLKIQKNLSEKLVRNFRRLEHHFDNCFVLSYPLELDEYLHFKFKEFTNSNNLLLNSIINCRLENKMR